MEHKLDFIDYSASTLTYFADGEQFDVTGEFNIRKGVLRHTHEFDDGKEMTLLVLVVNDLKIVNYKNNINVFGYTEKWGVGEIQRKSITIDKEAAIYGCDTDKEAVDYAIDMITDTFPLVDVDDARKEINIIFSGLIEK